MMTRPHRISWGCLPLCLVLLRYNPGIATAVECTTARVTVYFSSNGGATDAVTREINAATPHMLVPASHCTSAPIATVLVEAYKRGVTMLAVLESPMRQTSTAPPHAGPMRASRR